ncbi:MAG: hypothetical protein KAV01_02235 [Candidatus Lokiarchaeota archaeon]|nr:hypothetical protein [Candidatus Lokiarchaeota archaeon]
MSRNDYSSFEIKLKIQINNLITIYEQKAECGIFFKLSPEKSPLEILGVLDFLKYKIKKWGNTNIFSYQGVLFNKNKILVVGARNLEEAKSIMIFMFLSNIIDNEYEINNLIEKVEPLNDLELFLRNEISKNTEKDYPSNPDLELKLRNHLENIISENTNKTIN